MELSDLTEHFIMITWKNIAQKPLQLIPMWMIPSSMMMSQLFPMVPNVLLNAAVKVNQLAIENGQRKISEKDGTRLDESETAAWGRSQVH